MNRKRSNRPFHGHGSREEDFVFEEVSMNDTPRMRSEAPRRRDMDRIVDSKMDSVTLNDREIDAMVAGFASAQPKQKSGRRGKNMRAHIASNPSVNPISAKTVMVDGVKVANTRIHKSVEEEMKSHGIKKLPVGVSAADLAIPSYDSVVTATERRPLDCAVFRGEFQEGQLSPLEEMMRKSAERSGKKNEKGEKTDKKNNGKNSEKKKENKSENKSDVKSEKKAEKNQDVKSEKLNEKKSEKSEKQNEESVKTGSQKNGRKKERQNAPTLENTAQVQPTIMPGIPVTQGMPMGAYYPVSSVAQVTPVAPVTPVVPVAGNCTVLDPTVRAELLKQQEMLIQMIHQCHQTLATIQSQLLTPTVSAVPTVSATPYVPMPMAVPGGIHQAVQAPVQAPIPAQVMTSVTPIMAEEADENAENTENTQESSAGRHKLTRRERQRLKKQREMEEQAATETEINAETTEIVEVTTKLEERVPENRPGKKSDRKPEKNVERNTERQQETRTEKSGKKKGVVIPDYSDPLLESPEDFVSFEDDVMPVVWDSADNKKKEKMVDEFQEKTEKPAEKLKTPKVSKAQKSLNVTEDGEKAEKGEKKEKKGKGERVEKAEKGEKSEKFEKAEKAPKQEKSARNQKRDERLRQLRAGEFGQMGLSREILLALDDAQYATPSRIQTEFIPEALTGNDVMGQAQTGTGKTAAFAIPILQMVKFDEDSFDPQALILVPTRELAVQVKDEIEKLARYTDLECLALYGGKPLPPQVQQLREGIDIIVGTPGRVMDHIKRGSLQLRNLKITVLDEADRMLDIGFRPDIEKILRMAPQSRQTLLLSATIPPPVETIARKYMREPKILDCSLKDISSETIEQFYFTVDPELKFDLLLKLLERENPTQAIIFCRTKRGVERISHRLMKEVQGVESIHGDLQQRRRDRVMTSFRSGKTRYLVATDVVGRGIDVSGISHIINYDIPKFCDDYVHRVGRTGRMGHEGVAFTFVAPEEGNELTRIEMRINQLLKRDEIPGFASIPAMTAKKTDEDDEKVAEKAKVASRRRRRL